MAPAEAVAPSTPANLTAIAVSPSRINLNWSPSTDNVAVTGYRIYRDGSLRTSLGSVTQFQDTGLINSTTYSYTVQSLDRVGNASSQSPAVLATTLSAVDTTAPSTPLGLIATAISISRISLSWAPSTDNVAVVGYSLFRNGVLAATLGNVTTYLDTGLSGPATYTYTVQARDAAGNTSGLSRPASDTTLATLDNVAPSTPTGLAGNAFSTSQINLSWSASSDNVGVTNYRVYRDGVLLNTVGNVLAYSDTAGLVPTTTYAYAVQALDAQMNVSGLSTAINVFLPPAPDLTAPSTPAGLAANPVSPFQINLSWTASTDNVAVTGYTVLRNGVPLVSLGNVTAYQNTGLIAGTSYTYSVRAFDAAGNVSGLSAPKSATTPSTADTSAPTTPTGLIANALSDSQVGLSWLASTDNVAVTGYRLYRNGSYIGTVGSVTTAQDNGLAPSTTYSYRLDAIDAAGNASGISASASATTQATSSTAAQITQVLGTIADKASVTLGGSSFGTKPQAAPVLWDTVDNIASYAGLANGASIPIGGANPWPDPFGNSSTRGEVKYNTADAQRGVSTAQYKATSATAYLDGLTWPATNYAYVSWWWKVDRDVSGDTHSSKFLRMSNSSNETGQTFSWTQLQAYIFDQPDFSANNWNVFDGNPNNWNFFEAWFNSTNRSWAIRVNGVALHDTTWTGAALQFDELWKIGFDSGGVSPISVTWWMDDIYVDSSLARVMLGNAPTYSGSTHFEMQRPTAWSDTSIQVTLNRGSFAPGSTAYLYVVNPIGEVNANGFAVTF